MNLSHPAPKTHVISYASGPFLPRESAFRAEVRAFGDIDHCKVFHADDLSDDFRTEYRELLSQDVGGGYWIWKPRTILDYLENVAEGDVVFYVDVGCSVVNTKAAKRRFRELVNLVQQYKILRFQNIHTEEHSTNSTTLAYFARRYAESAEELANTRILAGGLIGFERCDEVLSWVSEWLSILEDDEHLFTNRYNHVNAHANFKKHSHDQSVSSLLSKCFPPAPAIVKLPSMANVKYPLKHPFLATRLRRAEASVVQKRAFKLTQLIWPLLTRRMRIRIWRRFFRTSGKS